MCIRRCAGGVSFSGRSRLVIEKVMKRDEGTYMCLAQNPAGVRRAIAAVRVIGQNKVYADYIDVCTHGSAVTSGVGTCRASGGSMNRGP